MRQFASSFGRAAALFVLMGSIIATGPAPARADQLSVEQNEGERGYMAVDELSYETIIDASDGYAATLRLRVALHNTSLSARDVVHSLALPFASQAVGLRAAREGVWTDAKPTQIKSDPQRRDPGTVFVRQLPPETSGDIPGAEVVAFGIEPGATIQVEVQARIYPRLRGGQWEIDLPARGRELVALAPQRRVLVKGLRPGEKFAVDDQDNGKHPYILTRPEDMVTVSWPSHIRSRAVLDGRYEVIPGPPGFDDGQFCLYLQLGPTSAPKPDHVVVLVDRSLSTGTRMQQDAVRVLDGLLDALPGSSTFEAWGFSRKAEPLVGATSKKPPSVDDSAARKRLSRSIVGGERGQGTDLSVALAAAAERTHKSKRPLVVVVTDGMVPPSITPEHVRKAFEAKLKRRGKSPEVLFIIDDPMLQRTGLSPEHPVARIAAALGARISLQTLSQIGRGAGLELLGSPRVLGNLELDLPQNMKLEDAVPTGLVAGNFVLLRGRYVGRPAGAIELSGRIGGSKIQRDLKASTLPGLPAALATVTGGDLEMAATEGFAHPPWYEADEQRTARRGIAQAGRMGRQRRGYLDRKIFRHYLTTRVLPRARVCYNHALGRNPTQAGRVLLQMEVGKGEVMLASTEQSELQVDDAKLVACMTEAAWALDIPAGKLDDQMYRIRYPLRLVPPKEGVPASVERIDDELLQVLLAQPMPK